MTKYTKRWLLCTLLVFALAASFALAACAQQATATFEGGEGSTGTAPTAITGTVGGKITLPANTFTRAGYTFAGWSDGTTTYAAGAEYTLAADVTFTAQWTDNTPTPSTPTEPFTDGPFYGFITLKSASEHIDILFMPNGFCALYPSADLGLGEDEDIEMDGAAYTVADGKITVELNETLALQLTIDGINLSGSVTLGDNAYSIDADVYTLTIVGASGDMPASLFVSVGSNPIALMQGDDESTTVKIDGTALTQEQKGTWAMPSKDCSIEIIPAEEPTRYTLSFDLGAHAAENAACPESVDLAKDETHTLPEAPAAAEGWAFDGWGDDKLAAGSTFTMQDSSVTLTAQWKKKQLTVTFLVGSDTHSTQTVDYGDMATKPDTDPTDPNGTKTFRYWTDNEGTEYVFSTPVTENLTLNAKFAICVTFDLDGGTGTQPAPVWEEKYSPTDISVQLPAAEGYSKGDLILTGWSDGENTYNPGAEETFTASAKLTAVWGSAQTEPTKYNVSYYQGYNAEVSGQAPDAQQLAAGEELTFPACTWTRKGYTFAGWKVQHWIEDRVMYPEDGGYWGDITKTVYQPQQTYTMPAENIQILATWTAATVTVSFDPNGGTGEMDSKTFTYGSPIPNAIRILQGTFSNAGKQFVGWAYTKDGPALSTDSSTPWNAENYSQYVQEYDGAYSLTLYAIWADAPIDFAELCGEWTNGEKSIILSQAGEDSHTSIVGSAIVNGDMYYSLVQGSNQLGDSDTYGQTFLISINSATSITCDGTTYTSKTALKDIAVADLDGSWTASNGTTKLAFTSTGKATYTLNGEDNSATLLCIDKYAVVICSSKNTIFILSLNEAKDKLTGSSRYAGGNAVAREYNKDTTPPIEEKTLKYVGEAQNVYGGMTVIFKSIEMIEGDDTYAKLTYTVNGTEHVDELKNDDNNKTFMKQITTGSWPEKSAHTVIKFWKMYPLANPPYTKNSNASYPGTSYSVGLTGDGTKLVIALSSGDVGVLTLEGSEELPPEDLPIFAGTATYTTKGFGNVTFTVTQIEIDPTVLTTKAYITYSTTSQKSERVAVTLTDNSNSKSNYEGEGTPKFYYSIYLSSESGRTEFYLAVIDDNTVVLCYNDDKPLGTFTMGGGTVTPEQKFDVTYSAGEHGSELALPESEQYAQGDSVTVGFGLDNVTEGDAHYEFVGWSDGKGNTYKPGETFDMPAEGITLTAQWESYTPTTKTLNDYLGVWEGNDQGKSVVKIKIESETKISYALSDDPSSFGELTNVEVDASGKYLVVTAEKAGYIPSMPAAWTLTMTFTEDEKATVEIKGSTSEFTRTSTIQPSEPEEKPQKPADADGKYTNPAGTPDLDAKFYSYGEYDFNAAELTGNKLHLVSSYPIDVDLTWDGNEATGYWYARYSLTVVATDGKLEITFKYGTDETFNATFTKVVMHDVTAKFEKGEESDVTGDTPDEITMQVADGEKASVKMPNAGTLAREGFTFDGWTIKNGDGTVYKTGATVEIESDTTFVPSWKEQSQGGGGSDAYTKLSDFVGADVNTAVVYGYDSQAAAEAAGQGLDVTSGNRVVWKVSFYVGKSGGQDCLLVIASYNTSTNPSALPLYQSDGSTKVTNLSADLAMEIFFKSGDSIYVTFSQNSSKQRQVTLTCSSGTVTWIAIGDEPQTGDDTGGNSDDDPATAKLSDFAGASSAEPVVYGFESKDAAGENGLVVSSTTTLFKIEFYYTESGFTIKRYWNATNSSVAQVKDESYSSTITDQNAANQTVTFKVAGQTLKFTFGTNDQGKRTVTMQVETSSGSGTYGASVTWTEIAA